MKIVSVAFLAFLLGVLLMQPLNLAAQQRPSPEAIANTLRSGTRTGRTTLARRLGISDPNWTNCVDDLQINVDHPHLDRDTETSVLRVECGYDLYLVLFGRKPGSFWKKLDTLFLYDAYNNATLAYQSLIRPGVQELVVQNAATVSGNLYESYFLVIRVVDGHFLTALAALETSGEPRIGSEPRSLKSTFTIQPATASELGEIDQVAHLMIGSRSFEVHSSYSWNDHLSAFAKDGADDISQLR